MKPQLLAIGVILIISCTLNYSSKPQKESYNNTYLNINKDKIIAYDIQDELYKSLPQATLEEREITKEPEWINIIATAYTAAKDETGSGKGITASGTHVSYSRGTIAAPHSVAFGSKLFIPELDSTYVVEDRGNPKYIRWINENTIRIDIYMKTKAEAKEFGVKEFKGYFIK